MPTALATLIPPSNAASNRAGRLCQRFAQAAAEYSAGGTEAPWTNPGSAVKGASLQFVGTGGNCATATITTEYTSGTRLIRFSNFKLDQGPDAIPADAEILGIQLLVHGGVCGTNTPAATATLSGVSLLDGASVQGSATLTAPMYVATGASDGGGGILNPDTQQRVTSLGALNGALFPSSMFGLTSAQLVTLVRKSTFGVGFRVTSAVDGAQVAIASVQVRIAWTKALQARLQSGPAPASAPAVLGFDSLASTTGYAAENDCETEWTVSGPAGWSQTWTDRRPGAGVNGVTRGYNDVRGRVCNVYADRAGDYAVSCKVTTPDGATSTASTTVTVPATARTTVYVNPSTGVNAGGRGGIGAPYQTVPFAIAQNPSNAIIRVQGPITVAAANNIGTAVSNIEIVGDDAGGTLIDLQDSYTWLVFQSTFDHVIIRNFKVRGNFTNACLVGFAGTSGTEQGPWAVIDCVNDQACGALVINPDTAAKAWGLILRCGGPATLFRDYNGYLGKVSRMMVAGCRGNSQWRELGHTGEDWSGFASSYLHNEYVRTAQTGSAARSIRGRCGYLTIDGEQQAEIPFELGDTSYALGFMYATHSARILRSNLSGSPLPSVITPSLGIDYALVDSCRIIGGTDTGIASLTVSGQRLLLVNNTIGVYGPWYDGTSAVVVARSSDTSVLTGTRFINTAWAFNFAASSWPSNGVARLVCDAKYFQPESALSTQHTIGEFYGNVYPAISGKAMAAHYNGSGTQLDYQIGAGGAGLTRWDLDARQSGDKVTSVEVSWSELLAADAFVIPAGKRSDFTSGVVVGISRYDYRYVARNQAASNWVVGSTGLEAGAVVVPASQTRPLSISIGLSVA